MKAGAVAPMSSLFCGCRIYGPLAGPWPAIPNRMGLVKRPEIFRKSQPTKNRMFVLVVNGIGGGRQDELVKGDVAPR